VATRRASMQAQGRRRARTPYLCRLVGGELRSKNENIISPTYTPISDDCAVRLEGGNSKAQASPTFNWVSAGSCVMVDCDALTCLWPDATAAAGSLDLVLPPSPHHSFKSTMFFVCRYSTPPSLERHSVPLGESGLRAPLVKDAVGFDGNQCCGVRPCSICRAAR
jgi:hypothetical protein